jgi:hypothetical protein
MIFASLKMVPLVASTLETNVSRVAEEDVGTLGSAPGGIRLTA